MAVEVNIRESIDRTETRGLRSLLRRLGGAALRRMGVRGCVLSILVTDDAEMRALNRQWRNLNRTTDVLSFESEGEILGDVVISLDQATRQAARLGVPRDEELARLLVHGMLHLLGRDHQTPSERRAMNALTEEILRAIL